MFGGNAGFRVESREHVAAGGSLEPLHTELHLFAIPKGPVLLLEEQQASQGIEARPQPGRVEVHQGEQGEGLWDCAHGVLRQEGGQPDGLLAQVPADRLLVMRRQVALIEKEVKHRVYAGEPRAQGIKWRRLKAGAISRSRSRARARRLCTFASLVNSLSAISAVLNPHRVFSAKTSPLSRGMASSQQTKSIRSRSSRTSPPKYDVAGSSSLAALSLVACCSIRSRPAFRRRSPIRRLWATR